MDAAGIWKDRQQMAMRNNPNVPEFYKWPSFMQGAIYYQRKEKLDSAQIFADSMLVYLEKYGKEETGLRRDSYMVLGIISLKRNNIEQALYYFRTGTIPVRACRGPSKTGQPGFGNFLCEAGPGEMGKVEKSA